MTRALGKFSALPEVTTGNKAVSQVSHGKAHAHFTAMLKDLNPDYLFEYPRSSHTILVLGPHTEQLGQNGGETGRLYF